MNKTHEPNNVEMVQLTKEEEIKCFEAFSAFDKNNNGYIDTYELGVVLQMMGQYVGDEVIYKMLAEANPYNDGKINFQ